MPSGAWIPGVGVAVSLMILVARMVGLDVSVGLRVFVGLNVRVGRGVCDGVVVLVGGADLVSVATDDCSNGVDVLDELHAPITAAAIREIRTISMKRRSILPPK